VRIIDRRSAGLLAVSLLPTQPQATVELGRLEAGQAVVLSTLGHDLAVVPQGVLRGGGQVVLELGSGALSLGADALLSSDTLLQIRDRNTPVTFVPDPFQVRFQEDSDRNAAGRLGGAGDLLIQQNDRFGAIQANINFVAIKASDTDLLTQELRDALLTALSASGAGRDGEVRSGALHWQFELDNGLLDHLQADDSILVDYELMVVDGQLQLQADEKGPAWLVSDSARALGLNTSGTWQQQRAAESSQHQRTHQLQILLQGRNDAPSGLGGNFNTRSGKQLVAAITGVEDEDHDPLSYRLVPGSESGGVVMLDRDGGFVFTPKIQSGIASFEVIANDGELDSNPIKITVYVEDAALLASPELLDVSELTNDPTPEDFVSTDQTQLIRVKAAVGATAFRIIDATTGTVRDSAELGERFSASSASYRINLQDKSLAAGQYQIQLFYGDRQEPAWSAPSTALITIDGTPALIDRQIDRQPLLVNNKEAVQGQLSLLSTAGVDLADRQSQGLLSGGSGERVDQRRVLAMPYWRDTDGDLISFSIRGGSTSHGFSQLQLANGTSADNGSVLTLDINRGLFIYEPNGSQSELDHFTVVASDPAGKASELVLSFNPRDALDGDGISAFAEQNLARLAGDPTGRDANFDGIDDYLQPAMVVMAGYRHSDFTASINSSDQFNKIDSIMRIQVNDMPGSPVVSSQVQLKNVMVIPKSEAMVSSLAKLDLASTFQGVFDPLYFEMTPLSSSGLSDLDPGRPGTQLQISLDVSRAKIEASLLNRYMKWISQETINAYATAQLPLNDLLGQTISQPGWYDFTQRTPNGDGARYIIKQGLIEAIEIILTDNQFGDIDPRKDVVIDPGMPINLSTTIEAPVAAVPLAVGNLEVTAPGSPERNVSAAPPALALQDAGITPQHSLAQASSSGEDAAHGHGGIGDRPLTLQPGHGRKGGAGGRHSALRSPLGTAPGRRTALEDSATEEPGGLQPRQPRGPLDPPPASEDRQKDGLIVSATAATVVLLLLARNDRVRTVITRMLMLQAGRSTDRDPGRSLGRRSGWSLLRRAWRLIRRDRNTPS
jgi:hypothetical protein